MNNVTFDKNTYYFEELSQADYGKLFLLSTMLNNKNIIYDSTISIMKQTKILNKSSLIKLIKKLTSLNIILEPIRKKGDRVIYFNPIYFKNSNFIWYKEIFDLFEDSVKTTLPHFKYLQLKSNWYEVNHQIVVSSFDELQNDISGIYKLYKEGEIVYVGKSKNIKGRIKEHSKTKDFDSFDFTILSNESDKNIYELYLIDKHKPILNKDCVEKTTSNIEFEELIFSNIIKL